MTRRNQTLFRTLFATGVVAAIFSPQGGAATLTWDGGTSGEWANGGGGWIGGPWSNANPDSAVFSGTGPTSVTIHTSGVTVDDLQVTGGTYTIGGSGTLTLANSNLNIGSGLTTTLTASLAGTNGLIKSGDGTLVLSGTNKNYSGTTVINAGAITIGNAAAGSLGSTATGAVTLGGGALQGQFSGNTNVGYAFSIGTAGGALRNLGNDSQRWQLVSNTISGSGVLTLGFGSSNTRFTMGTTTQTAFTGKWVIDSGGNVNRFVDVDGNSTFGNVTGDDAITLVNSGTILYRSTRTYGSTHGITIGTGGGNIATGGGQTVTLAAKLSGLSGNALRLDLGSSSSVLVLANTANNWVGATTLANSGTLRLGAAGVIADNGGTIDMGASTRLDLNGFSEAVGGLSGSGTVRNDGINPATLTLGGNNQNADFAGTVGAGTGMLHLAKTGNASQTLSGSIIYTGNTTVDAGTLRLNETANRTYAGQISGSGSLFKSGAGTLTLSHASSSIGRLRVDGGAITLTGGLSSHGTGAFAIADFGNATLTVAGGNLSISGNRELVVGLQSTGVLEVTSGTLSVASGVTLGIGSAAGLVFGNNGDGTLALSGGNTTIEGGSSESVFLARPRGDGNSTGNFSGSLILNGGVLETARTFREGADPTGGTKSSSIVINGGTLRALGSNSHWIDTTIDNLQFGSAGATIDTNGHDVGINRGTSGTGGLNKDGTGSLVLNGTHSHTGLTVVRAGSLIIGAGGALSSDVEVRNGATLAGEGVLGALTVKAGGTLAPGTSPGILETGGLTLEAGSVFDLEINGLVAGSGYDQAKVTGSVSLGGMLALSHGFAPGVDSLFFVVINDGNDAISGVFSNLASENSDYVLDGVTYRISYSGDATNQSFTGGNDAVLRVVPEPGPILLGTVCGLLAAGWRRRPLP